MMEGDYKTLIEAIVGFYAVYFPQRNLRDVLQAFNLSVYRYQWRTLPRTGAKYKYFIRWTREDLERLFAEGFAITGLRSTCVKDRINKILAYQDKNWREQGYTTYQQGLPPVLINECRDNISFEKWLTNLAIAAVIVVGTIYGANFLAAKLGTAAAAGTTGSASGGIAAGATGAASGGIGASAVTPITTAASAVSGAVKAAAGTLATAGTSGALSTVKTAATTAIKSVAPTVTKLAEDYAAQQIQQRIVNAATAGDRERLERMLQDLQRQELELRAQVGAPPSGIVYSPRQPGEPTFEQAEAATARAKQWNEAIKYGAIALVALAAAGGF